MVLRLSKKSPKWTFLCREPGAQPGGGHLSRPKLSKHRIEFWHFQKLSKNKDEIVYWNNFSEKSYLNFSLSYCQISPYKIYVETSHLIENFVNVWYLTTNILELWKLGRSFKMLVFLRHFYPFVRVPHWKFSEMECVCMLSFFSWRSSEE